MRKMCRAHKGVSGRLFLMINCELQTDLGRQMAKRD